MTTVHVRVLLLVGLFMLACLVRAQMPPDSSFLEVTVLTHEGAAVTGTLKMTCYLMDGDKHVPDGKVYDTNANVVTIGDLTTGPHELRLQIPELGVVDGPRTMDIVAGENLLEWRLAPVIPIEGELTVNGKAVDPTQVAAYVQRKGDTPRAVPAVYSDKRYHIDGLFAGDYTMMLLTDQGAVVTKFTVPLDQKGAFLLPLALEPAGAFAVQVTDATDSKPLPKATVSLRPTFLSPFIPPIYLTTDADGMGKTLPLPPGTWRALAYLTGYEPGVPTQIDVTADTPNTLIIKLSKVPTLPSAQ